MGDFTVSFFSEVIFAYEFLYGNFLCCCLKKFQSETQANIVFFVQCYATYHAVPSAIRRSFSKDVSRAYFSSIKKICFSLICKQIGF